VEIIAVLLVIGLILAPIIWAIDSVEVPSSPQSRSQYNKHDMCENEVSNRLNHIDGQSYVVFNNLVIRSEGNTAHTEIDHVIVSPYGIFSVETKSHQGHIYGYSKNMMWKQYLGNQSYPIYNPYKQNFKHSKALQNVLYVVFPNARKVMVDGNLVDSTIEAIINKISKLNVRVYSQEECDRMISTLSYASGKRDRLREVHNEEVQIYLKSKSYQSKVAKFVH